MCLPVSVLVVSSFTSLFQEVFYERVKSYKSWKEAEATLTKKRENKVKLELARKMDKIPQADDEITEVLIYLNFNISLMYVFANQI